MSNNRFFSKKNILRNLNKDGQLYNKIIASCMKGDVFPAIRYDGIYFYHKCQRYLFYKNSSFKTHKKYIENLVSEEIFNNLPIYLAENISIKETKQKSNIIDFNAFYEKIKESAFNRAGNEFIGVSFLYKYSYMRCNESVILLDVEYRFANIGRMPDIVLYNTVTHTLMFVEAKHCTNKDLLSLKNGKRKIIEQLDAYNKEIGDGKEIVEIYKRYIQDVKEAFGVDLPEPTSCVTKCGLYIFGDCSDVKREHLKERLLDNGTLDNHNYHIIENPKAVDMNDLWNKLSIS